MPGSAPCTHRSARSPHWCMHALCADPLAAGSAPEVEVDGWNATESGEYSFLYAYDPEENNPNQGKPRTLMLKCMVVDEDGMLVSVLAMGPDVPASQPPVSFDKGIWRIAAAAVPAGTVAPSEQPSEADLSPNKYGQLAELVSPMQAALKAQVRGDSARCCRTLPAPTPLFPSSPWGQPLTSIQPPLPRPTPFRLRSCLGPPRPPPPPRPPSSQLQRLPPLLRARETRGGTASPARALCRIPHAVRALPALPAALS
jgi:hypothetical protein